MQIVSPLHHHDYSASQQYPRNPHFPTLTPSGSQEGGIANGAIPFIFLRKARKYAVFDFLGFLGILRDFGANVFHLFPHRGNGWVNKISREPLRGHTDNPDWIDSHNP